MTYLPGAMTESVEHGPPVWEIVGSNPWSSQTNDLSDLYLLLPSQVLGIINIGWLAQCQDTVT